MLSFDPYAYHFNSRRQNLYAARGMAASSHPLASQAGMRMLESGGNAIDACVAMAMILPVVEPAATSFGSDNFAIVWSGGALHGMSASGWSPKALTEEYIRSKDYTDSIPAGGWDCTTLPGCVKGWVRLLEKFGTKTLAQCAAPAIEAAERGFPITPYVQGSFAKWRDILRPRLDRAQLESFDALFFPGGRPPRPGQIVKYPAMGRFLREVADTKGECMYGGEVSRAIVREARRSGGLWSMEDFSGFEPVFQEPLRISYRGYEICELPPNGQGLTALLALNILKGFEFGPEDFGRAETLHLQMEAMKLAFADAKAYIADPDYMTEVRAEQLLDPEYAAARRGLIGTSAGDFKAGRPEGCDTCYFCAADTDGNMISMIQSCYNPFGSGIVIPEYGLVMQSRGATFTIERGHPNNAGGHKRPYQTIIPAFLMKDGRPLGPFGVMGGFMQPQGHVQLAMNMIDFNMSPQDALDAPRFCWKKGLEFHMEDGFEPSALSELEKKGHRLNVMDAYGGAYNDRPFGRGQIILLTEDNVLVGGSDGRGDGCIIGR